MEDRLLGEKKIELINKIQQSIDCVCPSCEVLVENKGRNRCTRCGKVLRYNCPCQPIGAKLWSTKNWTRHWQESCSHVRSLLIAEVSPLLGVLSGQGEIERMREDIEIHHSGGEECCGKKRKIRKDSSCVTKRELKRRLNETTKQLLELHGQKGLEHALAQWLLRNPEVGVPVVMEVLRDEGFKKALLEQVSVSFANPDSVSWFC